MYVRTYIIMYHLCVVAIMQNSVVQVCTYISSIVVLVQYTRAIDELLR